MEITWTASWARDIHASMLALNLSPALWRGGIDGERMEHGRGLLRQKRNPFSCGNAGGQNLIRAGNRTGVL
jgi:hypothetical protein